MDRGLYVAATGMLAEMNRQDALSNNLANLTTPGFKADRMRQREFASVLMTKREDGSARGTMSLGPVTDQITGLSQGTVQQTDSPLDLALRGDGFFAVRAAGAVAYTRNGQFANNAQGQLVDAQGNLVLSRTGQPIQVGSNPDAVTVRPDGTVSVGANNVGQLQIVTLDNPRKTAESLWAGQPAGAAPAQVQQRALEASTSDATRTVIDMIASQRSFESSQRALRAIDESLQRAAQIGQVQ